MPNKAIIEFLRRLLAGTRSGAVEWSKDPARRSGFLASTESGSVKVFETAVDDDAWSTVLEIYNSDNEVLERVETEPLRPGAWRDWETELQALRDEARLSALGTAKTLETLANEWGLPPDPASDDMPF